MATPKRILILSQFYYPDITAAAFRIKETADLLTEKGYQVTVITAKPHKGKASSIASLLKEPQNVYRLTLIPYKGKGKWNYLAHYLSFMLNATFAGLVMAPSNVDVVLATSPPLFVGLAGLLVAKAKQCPLVLDIRDIWPDSAVTAGQLHQASGLYNWGKKLECFLYRQADLITCVARPMADYIARYLDSQKIEVIYNGVPQTYLAEKHDINTTTIRFPNDTLNLVHLGNMGLVQNLEVIIEAAREVQHTMPEVRFYLIGGGIQREYLTDLVRKYHLKNVIIDGPVLKAEALELMRQSSALFFQLANDSILEKTIPSKVFDYMSSGKPIVFGIRGEGKVILEQVQGNIFFEPNSSESFIKAIQMLKKNYPELAQTAKKNRQLVEQNYSRETMVDKLASRLIELIK